jgi:hypothetical protein
MHDADIPIPNRRRLLARHGLLSIEQCEGGHLHIGFGRISLYLSTCEVRALCSVLIQAADLCDGERAGEVH